MVGGDRGEQFRIMCYKGWDCLICTRNNCAHVVPCAHVSHQLISSYGFIDRRWSYTLCPVLVLSCWESSVSVLPVSISPCSHRGLIEWEQLLLHNNGRSHLPSSHRGLIEWGQHHCTEVHTTDQYHSSRARGVSCWKRTAYQPLGTV